MKFNSYEKNIHFLLHLPKFIKRSLIIFNDVVLCFFSVWFSFYLRVGQFLEFKNEVLWAAYISIFLALPVFIFFKVYHIIFRHSGLEIISYLLVPFLFYFLLYFSVVVIYGIPGVPRTLGIIQPFLFFLTMIVSRLTVAHFLIDRLKNRKIEKKKFKALIYGAGNSGRQLLSSLNKSTEIKVEGFLDDDKQLIGRILDGIRIYSPLDLKHISITKQVSHILLAIPSASKRERVKIIKKIEENKLNLIIKTLPSLLDIVQGKVSVTDIRDLDIEDILQRVQVEPDNRLLEKNIKSRNVLVTGAGGSIGQEICKQVLKLKPKKLILLDNNEYSLYSINAEVEKIKLNLKHFNEVKILPILGSVQDKFFISNVMKKFKPETVYHAAAFKHVPLVELNLIEGIKNNLFGTITIVESAIENNVQNFVLISTDKAVRPTNIMGASKRLAELCTQALSANSKNNKFKSSIVRFGNVIDSSGSVIPKFKKQIRNGGPITLTHPEVTRYFMSIPEAAQLVIQAGAMTEGNDLFILDMGKPIKIRDLIHQIIKNSGLSVKDKNNLDGDIEIMITGLRSGEKLHEELLLGENPQQTAHPKIQKVEDPYLSWDIIEKHIDDLKYSIQSNEINKILEIFNEVVAGFKPSKKVLDIEKNES